MCKLLTEFLASIQKLIELFKGACSNNTELGAKGELGKPLVFAKKLPEPKDNIAASWFISLKISIQNYTY